MKLGETGVTVKVDRAQYALLQANHGPEPLALLCNPEAEVEPIVGAEYYIGDMDLLTNAAHRAKEQAVQALYPNAGALSSGDAKERQAAAAEIQKAVFNDNGSRARLMRTAIVASNILNHMAELRSQQLNC